MPGSIQKRGDNYFLTVSAGTGVGGKRKRFTRTIEPIGKTETEKLKYAQKQLAIFIAEVEKGQVIESAKLTLGGFAQKWLKDYAEKSLAPKTFHRYKEIITSRIIPALGHIKLQNLKPTHLIEFYNNLAENGIRLDTKYIPKEDLFEILSKNNLTVEELGKKLNLTSNIISKIKTKQKVQTPIARRIAAELILDIPALFDASDKTGGLSERTILHHHRVLSAMLQDAVEWQLILNNPCERVKPPKVAKKDVNFYDEKQILDLLSALNTEPLKYKVMVLLDIYTGMRCGELMGLTWSKINLDLGTIKVAQASQYLPEKGTFMKETKNDSSVRSVSIPESLVEVLKKYKAVWDEDKLKAGDLWGDSELLFAKWNGEPMFTYTLTNWFPEFLTRHKLPHITPHGLRHTSATLLISQGINIRAVSERLGHARTSTTMDIYAHALKSSDREAADKLDNLLNNNSNMKLTSNL